MRSDATQLRLGPTQMRFGATQLRLGRTQIRSGATQLRLGQTQTCSGATQLRLPPTQMCSGATKLRLGRTQMGFGELRDVIRVIQLHKSKSKVRVKPPVATPVTVEGNSGSAIFAKRLPYHPAATTSSGPAPSRGGVG